MPKTSLSRLADHAALAVVGSFHLRDLPEAAAAKLIEFAKRSTHIQRGQYAAVSNTVQTVYHHLEFVTDTPVNLVASTMLRIDQFSETWPRSVDSLCSHMRVVAGVGDPVLWKVFIDSLDKTLQTPYLKDEEVKDRVKQDVNKLIEAHQAFNDYLPGVKIDKDDYLWGMVTLQHSKELSNDLPIVYEDLHRGYRRHDSLEHYQSGGHFIFKRTAVDGTSYQVVDRDVWNLSGVYKKNHVAYQQYLNHAERASERDRVDSIICLFSFTHHYPPLQAIEGIASQIATLEPRFYAESVKIREQLQAIPSADLLFSQFIDAVTNEELINADRDRIFAMVKKTPSETLPTILGVMFDILKLEDTQTKSTLLSQLGEAVASGGEGISTLFREVFIAGMSEYAKKFPEKPLDEVIESFLTDPSLTVRVSRPELERALKLFQRYQDTRDSLQGKSVDEISKEMAVKRSHSELKPEEYLAMTSEIFKHAYGIYPFNTQVLTCLMLIDRTKKGTDMSGAYAQIRTGEGKSLVLALLAGYNAVNGKRVDVITTNDYLAERDAQTFQLFFSACGLSSTYYQHERDSMPNDYDPNILYAKSSSLQLSYQRCGIQGEPFFAGKRFDCALIDEVDSVLLDSYSSKARIASPDNKSALSAFTNQTYRKFLEFASKSRAVLASEGVFAINPNDIRSYIGSTLKKADLERVKDADLLVLLHSSYQALLLTKGVDYITEKNEVVILDTENTGRRILDSQWSYGLHEAVSDKEGLRVPSYRTTIVEQSHHTFFGKYKSLVCLSGTLGDETDRHELESIYRTTGFDVPSHRTSIRVDEGITVFADEQECLTYVLEKLTTLKEQGRPALWFTTTVNDCTKHADFLSEHGIEAHVLDDVNNSSSDGKAVTEGEIIRRGGKQGEVTCATNTAGRGANYILNPTAKEAGGMHIIGGVFNNLRVEAQARGRAGRQGDPGSTEEVAYLGGGGFLKHLSTEESALLASVFQAFGGKSPEVRELIYCLRDIHTAASSMSAMYQVSYEAKHDSIIDSFFTDLRETIAWLRDKKRLPAEQLRLARQMIVGEWAFAYQAYDNHKALNELRVQQAVTDAHKNPQRNLSAIPQLPHYLRELEKVAAQHAPTLDNLQPHQRTALRQAIFDISLRVSMSCSPEVNKPLLEEIERLKELSKEICTHCRKSALEGFKKK